jgi:anti-anti-sigma factor
MRIADVQFMMRDGAVVARLMGEIDLSNAGALRTAITDATDVDYIDSTGIHLLYRLGESLRARGQALRLVIPLESPVNDALRLAGIKRHVDVVEHVDDGLRALAAAGA